jgi:hypothetical protein
VIQSPRAEPFRAKQGNPTMNLPQIDISSLPDLDSLTGLFGTLMDARRVLESDDSIVVLMTFVYEVTR